MLCPYQVAEARAMGADCILIIMAALTDEEAQSLEAAAIGWGMDVLVEVHDRAELERALRLKTPLLGINNRNLKTLRTDIATTEKLAAGLPRDRRLVSESGLGAPADLARMAQIGVRRFLIGEALMRQKDVEEATASLLASPRAA
jgi:indole-3-glycerol phosphate synthase